MNFDFSEEQVLLQDNIRRLLADTYSFEKRKAYIQLEQGFSDAIWQAYAEMGLLAMPFTEEDGGIGAGAEETMIAMEAFGRSLTLEPYLATVVIGAAVLRHGASREQRKAYVPDISEGKLKLAFAHTEAAAGYRLAHVQTTASLISGGYVLAGEKTLVLQGMAADRLIVSARLSGTPDAPSGIGLFMVDGHAQGVERRDYATQDGMRAAEISLQDVRVDESALLGGSSDALPVIRRAVDEAIAALCAEAVGAMDATLQITVEYLKTRKQFGKAIGEFQALQHRAAEMVVELEQARSMAMYATMMSRSENVNERTRAIASAKVQIGRSSRLIGQAAVQLHGGIGMTMEYPIGHYFKRLTMIEKAFGDSSFHLDQLAALDRI